jgi:hypothetical protein
MSLENEIYRTYSGISQLVAGGTRHPIAAIRCADQISRHPDRLSFQVRDRLATNNPTDESNSPSRDRPGLWNGPTFALQRICIDSSQTVIGIEAYISSYFEMLDSARELEAECLKLADQPMSTHPRRQKILSRFSSPFECLVNGGGVSAAIGGSTLVVFVRNGEPNMICARRSSAVSDQPGKYHVAPSFIFQPTSHDSSRVSDVECKVSHGVFREYLEELFDIPEDKASAEIYENPNLQYLRGLLATGGAAFEATGIAFNLLNHRPEICTLLLIRDEDWFQNHSRPSANLHPFQFNTEFVGAVGTSALEIQDLRWEEILSPKNITPSGAAAIVLGARRALEILNREQPAWLRRCTLSD